MSIFSEDRAEPIQKVDNTFADGIYFNMTDDVYHSLHRLSASGIKNILVSVPTFWAKSWMNPETNEEETEGEEETARKDDSSKAQILGRAYHVAIFEPETLDQRFVGEPDLSGYKNLLTSDAAVCAVLKELGTTQKKSGECPVERGFRLLDLDPSYSVKSIIMGECAETLGSRQKIGAKYWAQIHKDIERIEANPEIHDLVTGGASEVTILWTCPDSGIKMKSRIDKLKADLFVDLKSFANANGKPVNNAIVDQVQYLKYYLSMRVYQHAIAMIGQLDLQIMDEPDAPTKAERGEIKNRHNNLIETLRAKKTPHQPWLFFQEKGGIPNLLARRLKLQSYPDGTDQQAIGAEDHDIRPQDSVLARKADIEIRRAKQLFGQALEIYGGDGETWFPMDMIGEIGDEDFRDWFLDSVPA